MKDKADFIIEAEFFNFPLGYNFELAVLWEYLGIVWFLMLFSMCSIFIDAFCYCDEMSDSREFIKMWEAFALQTKKYELQNLKLKLISINFISNPVDV